MITYKINDKKYILKTDIYDVTIKNAIDIINIDILDKEKLNSFLEDDYINDDPDILKYNIEVLSILSNSPKDILEKLNSEYIFFLIMQVKTILLFLYRYNFENHESLGMTEVIFKGIKYFIPPSLIVKDDNILFYKEPAKNVLEVSNIMKIMEKMEDKGIEMMPYICAIYLRDNIEEVYDDEKVKERADIFLDLPLYIAYDLFFYTYYYICNSVIASRISLDKEEKRKKRFIKKIQNMLIGYIS